mgnify:CR=1 FL=1
MRRPYTECRDLRTEHRGLRGEPVFNFWGPQGVADVNEAMDEAFDCWGGVIAFSGWRIGPLAFCIHAVDDT